MKIFAENSQNYILYLINLIAIITGIYVAKTMGYGIESEPRLTVFTNLIENGIYEPSRYYGHPVSEIILGFLGYFFGGKITNFICFLCFLSSIYFFYFTFYKNNKSLIFFFLLVITNSNLFLQSSDVSDFPIALIFFSLGLFFYKKKGDDFLSIFFFTLCMGSRLNFALFIYIFLFYEIFYRKNFEKIRYIFLLSFTTSLLFLPIFFQSKMSLSFLYNDGGPPFNLQSLIPRFLFKVYKMIGVFSIFVFIYVLFNKHYYSLTKKKIFLLIIFFNLILFFMIPSKMAILQPFIIFLYLTIINLNSKKIIYFLVFFNFLEWFISYDFLDIKYRYKDICKPVHAISATLKLKISEGNFSKHEKKLLVKKCHAKIYGNKFNEYLNDKALK